METGHRRLLAYITSVSSPEAREIFLLSIYGMPRRDTDWLDLGHVPIIIARQSWSHSQEPHERDPQRGQFSNFRGNPLPKDGRDHGGRDAGQMNNTDTLYKNKQKITTKCDKGRNGNGR